MTRFLNSALHIRSWFPDCSKGDAVEGTVVGCRPSPHVSFCLPFATRLQEGAEIEKEEGGGPLMIARLPGKKEHQRDPPTKRREGGRDVSR